METSVYRPGFWCAFFWFLTWVGLLGGIAAVWLAPADCIRWMTGCWSGAGVTAVISYVIRTAEKSRLEGRWSWHWFD